MAKRGGKRPGAGRPKGSRSSAQKLILAERAREHTETAFNVLVEIAENTKEIASARVTAALGLLDRGYGKPWHSAPYESPAAVSQQPPAAEQAKPEGPSIFDLAKMRARYGMTGDSGNGPPRTTP